MPLYEYECSSCAHRFERIQRFSDPLVDVCPKCGASVRKLLSSPAIQFKGSGFYITDYSRQGQGVGGESSSSSKSEGGDQKADGGDKKDDKKTESSQKSSDTSESKPASTPSKSDG